MPRRRSTRDPGVQDPPNPGYCRACRSAASSRISHWCSRKKCQGAKKEHELRLRRIASAKKREKKRLDGEAEERAREKAEAEEQAREEAATVERDEEAETGDEDEYEEMESRRRQYTLVRPQIQPRVSTRASKKDQGNERADAEIRRIRHHAIDLPRRKGEVEQLLEEHDAWTASLDQLNYPTLDLLDDNGNSVLDIDLMRNLAMS
ncbi:hypothetical protein F5Y15DRAFT_418712 [Xylariaceae sp. FL0016]|nr:hypothetical protein F5Y15DRAFT_418712 [Xylariaceae sp. FL0016]